MNTTGATFFLLTLGAIATAYCIKKNDAKVRANEIIPQEQTDYYIDEFGYSEDVYDMFYSQLADISPAGTSFTDKIKLA